MEISDEHKKALEECANWHIKAAQDCQKDINELCGGDIGVEGSVGNALEEIRKMHIRFFTAVKSVIL